MYDRCLLLEKPTEGGLRVIIIAIDQETGEKSIDDMNVGTHSEMWVWFKENYADDVKFVEDDCGPRITNPGAASVWGEAMNILSRGI